VIALLAGAIRPEAVRSLAVSEPGALRLAEGTPVVDTMIANGKRLYADPGVISGQGHTILSTGAPYNKRLEAFLRAAEAD
jgi:hypothetical protein